MKMFTRIKKLGKTIRDSGKNGMTLVETIVAFAIIGIILVVAIMGFNTMASVSTRAQDINKANQDIETLIVQGEVYDSDEATLRISAIDPVSGETIALEIPGTIQTYEQDGGRLRVFQND